MTTKKGFLDGITVLDLSAQLPGPYATMLMRGFGARVIKVEPPDGDAARQFDLPMFSRINAGKELIQIDLKCKEGLSVLRELARKSDVLIEGFRPGVLQRLGAGYEEITKRNPRIVFCSLSGYGQQGPYAGLPGHDLNFLALAGAVPPEERHGEIGMPIVDLAAGTTAAFAIVSALRETHRTGFGTYLDISMLDVAVAWSSIKVSSESLSPDNIEPTYGVFVASDGIAIAIALLEDRAWIRLCDALEWHNWRQNPDLDNYYKRCGQSATIVKRLIETIATSPAQHWLALAIKYELPLTAVLSRPEVALNEQVETRQLILDDQLQPPLPSEQRITICRDAEMSPNRDIHTILTSIEWKEDQISRAYLAGAFGSSQSIPDPYRDMRR